MATVPLEHRRTVNSEWYSTNRLPKIFGEIRKTNMRRRIIVQHDNVSSYTSAQTSALLARQNAELMGPPPCISKTMLWTCLNRSEKSASTSGLSACSVKNNENIFNGKYSHFHYQARNTGNVLPSSRIFFIIFLLFSLQFFPRPIFKKQLSI